MFENVREEIAARRQELCLLIEDLVLLHGIDKQLAQALTIPASARLCKLRAAIAVTSGYLASMDTFTDRGVQFTLDIGLDAIGGPGLRDFVGRYLNAGRLPSEAIDGTSLADSDARVLEWLLGLSGLQAMPCDIWGFRRWLRLLPLQRGGHRPTRRTGQSRRLPAPGDPPRGVDPGSAGDGRGRTAI